MSSVGIPGKITVKQFNLLNDYGTAKATSLNVWGIVNGFTIYENIFDSCMWGIAKFEDSNNIYSTFPITTDTYIKITLQSPTTGEEVHGLYRIYKVSDIKQETPKLQTYIVHFVSAEMFNSRKVRISKHVGGNIPSVIEEIHKKISSKPISITKDAAKANILIPYIPAFSAISLLLENAKWRAAVPDYCYWETFRSFNCKSLAACSLENPLHDFSTCLSTDGGVYKDFDYQDFTKITDVISEQTFDSVDLLYKGGNGATIYTYNPLEGSCDIKMVGENPMARLYTFSSNSLDYKALSERHQILSNITNSYYYIRVPGLLSRSAGDMANVTIYNGNQMNVKDTTLSGRRLICGIAHVISMDEYYQNITLGEYYLGKNYKQ